MKFRDRTRFPRHDSSLVKGSEFLEVANGVDTRCGMAILNVRQNPGTTAEEMLERFNKRYDNPYRITHVRHALKRLVEAGFVTQREKRFYVTEAGLARWRKCPKERV